MQDLNGKRVVVMVAAREGSRLVARRAGGAHCDRTRRTAQKLAAAERGGAAVLLSHASY